MVTSAQSLWFYHTMTLIPFKLYEDSIMTVSHHLIHKYNVAGPRYTSYPTVPYWQEQDFTVPAYLQTLARTFIESNQHDGISLYIHLPFCESLCTFCACNHRITKNHSVEAGYIAVMNVRQRYLEKGKFGATGEELKAVQLLAEASLDYWNRRSGALFHFACEQLRALRAEQSKKFKEEQEQERKAA